MSLKNVVSKIIASATAIYMVFGNFAIAGMGIAQVVAEDVQAPQIMIEQEVQKYVQYAKENDKGVILQTSIKVSNHSTPETYLPIVQTNLEIQVPRMNGQLPSRIKMLTANTTLTNGNQQGNINQSYHEADGLLTISYTNTKDSDGKLYAEYKENTKDEFEIIYIYAQDAYVGENVNCNVNETVKANVVYQTENSQVAVEGQHILNEEETANKGDIAEYMVTSTSEVYKGYMYSNEAHKTNYVTDYKTTSILSVIHSQMMDNMNIDLKESNYTYTKEEQLKELNTNTIEYKTTKITEQDFRKMFGTDGYINFYLGDTKYASIQYTQTDKKGEKSFSTTYYTVEKQEIEPGTIEYPEGTTQVKIETSKPQTEGNIKIENEKVIKAVENYGKAVKNLQAIEEKYALRTTKKYIVEEDKKDEQGQVILDENGNTQKEQVEKVATIVEQENYGMINLQEPTTKISVEFNSSNLSTLSLNKVTATIKLDDTNSSCQLFKTNEIELTLPKNLTSAKITSAKSLYENGLDVKDVRIENERVKLKIEGEQTAYDIENISGGVNIVLDLELDLDNVTPTHQETLVLTYGKIKVEKEITIVSKSGLLMLVETNVDNKNITTFDSAVKTLEIERKSNQKTATQIISLINNNSQELTNLELLGNLDYSNENIQSNFKTKLASKISLENANIYYSLKKQEISSEGEWSDTYLPEAKSYKVVIPKLAPGEKIQLKVNVIIPGNLDYNKESYLQNVIKYDNQNNTSKQHIINGFVTEKREILFESQGKEENYDVTQTDSINMYTLMTAGEKVINENDKVYEGQILRYTVTLENTTGEELTNLKMQTTIGNAVYYEIGSTGVVYTVDENGNEKIATGYITASPEDVVRNIEEITIPAHSRITYEYQVLVTDDVNNISNNIKLFNSEEAVLIEKGMFNEVQEAKLKTELKYAYNEERKIYSNDQANLIYKITTFDEDLNNIKAKIVLPEELKIKEYETFGEVQNISMKEEDNGDISISIESMHKNTELKIILVCNTASLDTSINYKDVKISSTTTVDNEEYHSNNLIKTIEQSETALSMVVEKKFEDIEYTKDTDLQYDVTIQNNGQLDLKSCIATVELDEGLTVKELYINGQKQENENLNETYLNLVHNSEIKLTYILALSVDDADNVDTLNVTFNVASGYTENLTETSTIRIKQISEDDNNNNDNNNNNNNNDDNPIEEKTSFNISGVAWLDMNKDGRRDKEDTILSGINVRLINAKTEKKLKDSGMTATTDGNGVYTFENLEKGKYLVIFEFDTNQYTVTTYQKEGVEDTANSDAIINNISLDGKMKLVGITDYIEITDDDIKNIDIGLIENAKFDLSLDKQIGSIIITNAQGTKTTEYKNKDFVKVDLVAKYMNNTNVIITYKFIIKNEGEVTAYVDSLVDNLPSGLEFSSELNKDWYKGNDGNLYTTSLSGIAIAPGTTSETELVLTKKTTENTTGTFTNNAEIDKMSNLEAIKEKEEAKANNKSSADIIISIKTGSPFMYMGITIGCLTIIVVGAYIIKKKVLNRGIL